MGEVHEFATGAVRGTAQVPRYDLVPLVGLRRLAETSAEGAEKFGAGNWLKGIPSSNLLSHTLNHIFLYLDGDRSEDHLGHAIWGLAATAHNEERCPDMHDLSFQGGLIPEHPTVAARKETEEILRRTPEDVLMKMQHPGKGNVSQADVRRAVKAVFEARRTTRQRSDPGIPPGFSQTRREVAERVRRRGKWPFFDPSDGQWWIPFGEDCLKFGTGDLGCFRAYWWLDQGLDEDEPSGPDPIDSEIDGLPSVATAAPSGPHDPPDPTAEKLCPSERAVEVLNRVVMDRKLPDGTAVDSVLWKHREFGRGQIEFVFQDSRFLAQNDGPTIVVHDPSDRGELRRTARCWEIEEILNQAVQDDRAGTFADAALSAVKEFFGPSGPREGLQEPTTPQSPMDAEYDEWVDMVSRVNASAFRPWQDSRAGWCARSPVTKRIRIFGQSFDAYAAAYRWVHQLLDQSSMVATQPPSAPGEGTSS